MLSISIWDTKTFNYTHIQLFVIDPNLLIQQWCYVSLVVDLDNVIVMQQLTGEMKVLMKGTNSDEMMINEIMSMKTTLQIQLNIHHCWKCNVVAYYYSYMLIVERIG